MGKIRGSGGNKYREGITNAFLAFSSTPLDFWRLSVSTFSFFLPFNQTLSNLITPFIKTLPFLFLLWWMLSFWSSCYLCLFNYLYYVLSLSFYFHLILSLSVSVFTFFILYSHLNRCALYFCLWIHFLYQFELNLSVSVFFCLWMSLPSLFFNILTFSIVMP